MPLSLSFPVPLLLLLLFSGLCPTLSAIVVSIKSVTTIAKTDDNFVCATMDWWPPDKCNYGICPWGNSSILNLDLNNPILVNALKGNDKDLIRKIQDPYYLDQVAQTFNDALITVGEFGPWSSPWIGESGGAYNSGGKSVSNAFVDGFCFTSANEQGQHGEREEYHLTAQGGDLRSSEMLLNGKLLKLTPSFEIPPMEPSIASAGAPLRIAPLSIAFVRFKDFKAPACAGN
ncbi:hypothetical protein BHM03_00044311 [Ensete ventricosum]|nr:hypothetical protein BHM03_00044311 [Ensete ventricosum]